MPRNPKTATSTANSQGAILIFCGEDEPELKRAVTGCIQKLMPDDSMNYEVIDGQVESVDQAATSIGKLREAILTYPFFGGKKLVWWKGANMFEDSGVGKFASVKDGLAQLLEDLNGIDGESVMLVISTPGMHKGRTFTKSLLQIAEVQYFDPPDLRNFSEDRVMDMIYDRMKAAGLNPGQGSVERFFEATGVNTSFWEREIEKLVCYVGDEKRPISRADVELIVSETREVIVWDFCTAVLRGDARMALTGLSALYEQEESDIGILYMLIGQVRMASLGLVLKEERMMKIAARGNFVSADLAPNSTPYMPKKKTGETVSTFVLAKATQTASRRSSAFWLEALGECYTAHRKMISGAGDKRRLLEQLVLVLCG